MGSRCTSPVWEGEASDRDFALFSRVWETEYRFGPKRLALYDGFTRYGGPVAVDAAGVAHVAFCALNANASYYVALTDACIEDPVTGCAWVQPDPRCSLVLDGLQNAHISFYKAGAGGLYYATNAGGWSTTLVDGMGDVGYSSSIALDSAGNVNIAYSDRDQDSLKWASSSSGAWSTATIDPIPGARFGTHAVSLALDPEGNACVLHSRAKAAAPVAAMRLVTNESGSWRRMELTRDWPTPTSLGFTIDAAGAGHGAIADTNGDVRYLRDFMGRLSATSITRTGPF